MPPDDGRTANLIGSPLKMPETPVTYAEAPPALGADTGAVPARTLGLAAAELRALAAAAVIAGDLNG